MRAEVQECVAEQLPPPPFLHTKILFSKKVNFMEDLRRKYVCRSAVALVETHFFGVPFRSFSVFWWHRETYLRWVRQ